MAGVWSLHTSGSANLLESCPELRQGSVDQSLGVGRWEEDSALRPWGTGEASARVLKGRSGWSTTASSSNTLSALLPALHPAVPSA